MQTIRASTLPKRDQMHHGRCLHFKAEWCTPVRPIVSMQHTDGAQYHDLKMFELERCKSPQYFNYNNISSQQRRCNRPQVARLPWLYSPTAHPRRQDRTRITKLCLLTIALLRILRKTPRRLDISIDVSPSTFWRIRTCRLHGGDAAYDLPEVLTVVPSPVDRIVVIFHRFIAGPVPGAAVPCSSSVEGI